MGWLEESRKAPVRPAFCRGGCSLALFDRLQTTKKNAGFKWKSSAASNERKYGKRTEIRTLLMGIRSLRGWLLGRDRNAARAHTVLRRQPQSALEQKIQNRGKT